MLAKFSVKKPFTVLVAVILVILLGVVAFTRMTPDLLPSLEFPYAVVVTTYAGASPETVEQEVTKPLEQSMATLDGIKAVTSNSSENYSLVLLEFADRTDMDTTLVNMREKINLIRDSWNDSVGTPYILRINPNMLPVTVAAASFGDMSAEELSAFAREHVVSALEGVEGVASVSAVGLIEESVEVKVNAEKLAAANERLSAAIVARFGEGIDEVESGIASAENALGGVAAGRSQLAGAQTSLVTQIEAARLQLTEGRSRLVALQAEKPTLLPALETASAGYEQLDAQRAALFDSARAADPSLAGADDGEIEAFLRALDPGDPRAAALSALDAGYAKLDAALSANGLSRAELAATIDTLNHLDAKLAAADDALAQLNAQYAGASAQLNGKLVDLAVGQSTLNATLSQLQSALSELESQRQAALESADLTGLVTADTVSSLLAAENFSLPAGYIGEGDTRYLVSVGDRVESVSELKSLVLLDPGLDGVAPVRLVDVADVAVVTNADATYARIDGSDGLLFSFQKQSGYATATVSANIAAEFAALSAQYDGLRFTALMDQGDYIRLVVASVLQNLALGAALAVLVLLLFLRDLRPTLITALSIPVSLTFAVVLMYFSGVTLNVISLCGLAVGVGMLVDNSIVVIENIFRLRKRGESARRAAISGAAQVTSAILGSTLTTVCVFFPLVFVQGITRQLFTDMALTISYSLLASLAVALTVVPAAAEGLLRNVGGGESRAHERAASLYRRCIGFALRHKALFLGAAALLLAASLVLALARGYRFLPDVESNQISVTYTLPEGSALEETAAASDEAAARIAGIDGVDTVGCMLTQGMAGIVGLSASGGEATDSVTMYVLLRDGASSRAVTRQIRERCADLPGELEIASESMMTSYSDALGGSGVAVKVYADDLDDLRGTAVAAAAALAQVEGVARVDDGIAGTVPELRVTVDKDKAMSHGLTVAQVYAQLAAALSAGRTATELRYDGAGHDVVVSGDTAGSMTAGKLRMLTLQGKDPSGGAEELRLSDIARVSGAQTLGTIEREGQRRCLTVTGTLAEGYNITLVTDAARTALAALTLPTGTELSFEGENETIMSALKDLLTMLLLGVVLVYLIMVAQFQSLISPLIVMFTIPLAFTGGLLALLLAGMEISVVAMIGFVMLVGVIVNNGIVLIDCINQLRAGGMARSEAIPEACVTRLRPVLMTALTTILGLLPLALGMGLGADLIQPVAVVCVGGLTYATAMTLFIVPVLYELLNKKELRVVSQEDAVILDD